MTRNFLLLRTIYHSWEKKFIQGTERTVKRPFAMCIGGSTVRGCVRTYTYKVQCTATISNTQGKPKNG